MQIDELLKLMVDQKASDLHLKVGCVPVFRIDGALVRQEQLPKLDFKDIESIFQQVTTSEQMATFIEEHELDFAYGVPRFSPIPCEHTAAKRNDGFCLPVGAVSNFIYR